MPFRCETRENCLRSGFSPAVDSAPRDIRGIHNVETTKGALGDREFVPSPNKGNTAPFPISQWEGGLLVDSRHFVAQHLVAFLP